jgi:hypothetical protein
MSAAAAAFPESSHRGPHAPRNFVERSMGGTYRADTVERSAAVKQTIGGKDGNTIAAHPSRIAFQDLLTIPD